MLESGAHVVLLFITEPLGYLAPGVTMTVSFGGAPFNGAPWTLTGPTKRVAWCIGDDEHHFDTDENVDFKVSDGTATVDFNVVELLPKWKADRIVSQLAALAADLKALVA